MEGGKRSISTLLTSSFFGRTAGRLEQDKLLMVMRG